MKRHLTALFSIIVIMVAGMTGYAFSKNSSPYEATVFVTIGSTQAVLDNQVDPYKYLQAADQFSETVMGWFKNPDFARRVTNNNSSQPTARKQEKQNIIVSFTSNSPDDAKKTAMILQDELKNMLNAYNLQLNSNFQIPVFSVSVNSKSVSLPFFVILGILAGFFAALFWAYGFEYVFSRVSTSRQAEEILQKNAVEYLKTGRFKPSDLHYLEAYTNRLKFDSLQIVGMSSLLKHLKTVFPSEMGKKKVTYVNFPKESKNITHTGFVLVVCELGKTSSNDLKKLKSLLPPNFDLVIVES